MLQIHSKLSIAGSSSRRFPSWRAYVCYANILTAVLRNPFFIIVLVPTLLSSLYFGLIATPQYVSHTAYVVRGVNAHRSPGLGALLSAFGVSRAADETSAIEAFLKSREMIARLDASLNLREAYAKSSIDRLSRFPRPWQSDTFESLYSYMQDFIHVAQDPTTGVARLELAAFHPADAHRIAEAALRLASEMANSLNREAQADTLDVARKEVRLALEGVVEAQRDLTEYRNRELLVDPLQWAGEVLKGVAKLSLAETETNARLTESEKLSPLSPGIGALQARQTALEKQIKDERERLAGGHSALAAKIGDYDRLTLLRDLADKHYSSALLSLQAAEDDAQRKRVYIEKIVSPETPDDDTRPERLRSVLSVFVIAFMAFSILWILSVGARDHAQWRI